MSLFAPVVPLPIAQILHRQGQLGDYHLLLAHDVTPKNMEEYQELYYSRMLEAYPLATVIMDNSVVELGSALTFERVLFAANAVFADYMVAPDLFLEKGTTIERSKAFVDEMQKHTQASNGSRIPSLMGVVQGKTIAECMECAAYFAGEELFEAISIPRCLTPVLGSRMELAYLLYDHYPDRFNLWHLLGFSDDLFDDLSCARLPFINGIDSAVPIRAALKDQLLSLNTKQDFGPRGDYWESSRIDALAHVECIQYNLEFVRSRIQSKFDTDGLSV